MRAAGLTALLVLAAAGTALADQAEPQAGDTVAVIIENERIYPYPAFYASPAEPIAYGTMAVVVGTEMDWLEVEVPGTDGGWLHRTAATGALHGDYSDWTEVSGEVQVSEVMLAGRGFSEEMEQAYSEGNPSLDFAEVDLLLQSEVTPEELYAFLVEGNLLEPVEGAEQTQEEEPGETSPGERRPR